MDLTKLSKPKLIELITAERAAFASAFIAQPAKAEAKEVVAVYCDNCEGFNKFDSLDKAQKHIAEEIEENAGGYNPHEPENYTVIVGREVKVESSTMITFS